MLKITIATAFILACAISLQANAQPNFGDILNQMKNAIDKATQDNQGAPPAPQSNPAQPPVQQQQNQQTPPTSNSIQPATPTQNASQNDREIKWKEIEQLAAKTIKEQESKGRAKASATKTKFRLVSNKDQMTGKETLLARIEQSIGSGIGQVEIF